MQKITACLWFDTQAEEAAQFYTSVFKNSKIIRTSYYGETGQDITGKKPGTVLTVDFEIEGQRFTALNGGPDFTFNESVSFMVDVATQEELDEYWSKLSVVPESEQCGWLKDKFGVSWQIVPSKLDDMLCDPDSKKAEAVMGAMLKMKKLDIAALEAAYNEAK